MANLSDSNLEYNGIKLFIVKTNMFSHKAIYTPDNVDYLYTEFTLDISCIYNPGATSYDNSVPPVFTPGELPSQTNASIRHYLMQPRANLFFEGYSPTFARYIIQSPQILNGIDANNGPQPISCDVYQLINDSTWHVHYVIKTWLLECPNDNFNAFLSNRWSQSQWINNQRMMVRKTIGQAFFRTDILALGGGFVDLYRNQIIAFIPPKPGLFREEVKFVTTPAGNALHYEITDIERTYNLGDTIGNETYITKVDGYFSQGTMQDDPATGPAIGSSLARMKVQLWGMYEANNWTLTQIAFQIIDRQLSLDDIGPPRNNILRSMDIVQSIADHYVEVEISVQIPLPDQQIKPALPFNDKYLMQIEPINALLDPGDAGINPGLQNDSGSRGSDPVYLRSALIKEACSEQSIPVPNQNTDNPGQQTPYGDPPNIQIFQGDILPSIQSDYKPDPNEQPYTRATTESQYQYDSGTLQAPIANPNNPSSGGTGSTGTTINGPYRSEILNFHAPVSTLHVDWTVERLGIPPNIPHFIRSIQCLQSSQQSTLKSAIVKPYAISLSNDLVTPWFTVTGSYDYFVPYTNDPNNPPLIVFDVPPNINAQYGDAFIQGDNNGNCANGQLSSQYVHGIIDSGSDGSTGGGQGDG